MAGRQNVARRPSGPDGSPGCSENGSVSVGGAAEGGGRPAVGGAGPGLPRAAGKGPSEPDLPWKLPQRAAGLTPPHAVCSASGNVPDPSGLSGSQGFPGL